MDQKKSDSNRSAKSLENRNAVEFNSLDDYEDVLGHMRAADVFASPSTREGSDSRLLRRWPRAARLSPADHPIRRPTRYPVTPAS